MARTRMDRETRRAELVEAAARLFAEKGLDGTAVSDIVAAVGVSQGTFYWYFESKEQIADAVVERFSEAAVAGALAVAERPETPALEKLLLMRDALLASLTTDREVLAFFHREGNEAFHDLVSREAVRRMVPEFERVIVQGVAEGVFHIRHSDDAARFIATLTDVTDPFDLFQRPKDVAHHTEALTEFALRGLGCSDEVVDEAIERTRADARARLH
jgi:AcrR family transcriptional regulator